MIRKWSGNGFGNGSAFRWKKQMADENGSKMDKLKMKLFLRSQKEFNNKNPDQLHIIGFGVHYKI